MKDNQNESEPGGRNGSERNESQVNNKVRCQTMTDDENKKKKKKMVRKNDQ